MATLQLEAELSDPVVRHMRTGVPRLHVDQTVAEALASLRERPPEGRIIYFYVVDGEGRLCGVVPTRRLVLSSLDRRVADIMVKRVIAIPHSATVLDACEFFILHRLLAFPIVDEERRLLGVVDVELYTNELADVDRGEQNDDLFQLIGVHLTEARHADPWRAFRHRFPWLLCNIAGGLLAAFLSFAYQRELAWQDAVLALFVPVVLALAESVSIQSVSLALQTLQGSRPTWSVLARKVVRELLTGGLLGVACSFLIAGVALVWLREPAVAGCLLGGIFGGVAAAAGLGLTTPYLLRILRRDPQVAAGPIALACSDMASLLVYFNLARWLLP